MTVLAGAITAHAAEPIFIPVKIDGPKHDPPNHTYWYGPFSECCSVADFDGDGDLDLAAGRNWYEAPDWIKHTDFRDGARINGPETENNSEFTMDVNFDGRPDVVNSGWMRDRGAFWYENPGPDKVKAGVKWKDHRIHTAHSMEGVIHGDIDGDGDQDILCNHWSLQPGQGMTWIEHIDKAPWFVEHIIGTEGEGHGNGLGDINMDGRIDIVTPSGWWQCPAKPAVDDWTFHADYRFKVFAAYAAASHPMLVVDVDQDGLNDILVGAAHTYGLAWLQQGKGSDGERTFKQHWVETEFGQFHTMAMGDLDGDGKPDLLTGKRLFAHHGRDVSCYEPLAVFWYDMKGGTLNRHILAFNHLQDLPDDLTKRNPPPNFVPAVGMKIHIKDMDADGYNDAVICGKGGLYIFYRRGTTPTLKPPHRLPPEDTYPTWERWQSMPRPDPPPIPRKIHGAGPAPPTKAEAATGVGDKGWVTLFDGTSLDHWQTGPDRSWVVEDGAIALQREFDGKEHNLDYLWTRKPYRDFVLDIEFKVPQKANSGVFLRTSDLKDPVYTGLELQVTNSYGRPTLTRGGTVGAMYDLKAPKADAAKPAGQWNTCRVTCRGPHIVVEVNGRKVNELDLDQWTEPHKNPDGSKNKFPRAIKDFSRRGYIGLQDHGRPVWYRNIRIQPLD
ncbi:MAG: family 16 glycoside hydrolase [Pirellulales bacterium]